jgi:transcriptional regulator with XRE-family HTH domain
MTGIPGYRISQWECGHGSPKLLSCQKLAHAFGMTLDEFADQANKEDVIIS